jgi:intracellular protein transport protein USO1
VWNLIPPRLLYLRSPPVCHWVNVVRASLQKLIVSGVGGKDQFVFRITQFRETSEFRDFREQVTFSSNADNELPDLWFDLAFVEFLKDNYSIPFGR